MTAWSPTPGRTDSYLSFGVGIIALTLGRPSRFRGEGNNYVYERDYRLRLSRKYSGFTITYRVVVSARDERGIVTAYWAGGPRGF